MRIQKMLKNMFDIKVRPMFGLLLLLILAPISSTLADGFGVSSDASSNTAKINALLQNVQNSDAPTNNVGQNNNAPQNQAPANTSQNPYGNDPVGNTAFAGMVRNLLPLTPEQIKTLHYLFDQSQQAAAQSPGLPPKPTSASIIVNLSPGAAPPVIRLQQGYVSSLVFVDATGGSWPIQAYDLGSQNNFNVQWDQKGNTLMVQALSRYESGNMAVMLKGLDTPIMITLITGQHAVDYRADLRIPKIGPNPTQVLEGLPGVENPQLVNVLDGVPPKGAQPLIIHGGGDDCQAWLVEGRIFLRTTMSILSPAWTSTMRSADGTHAYELPATPVILALSNGKTVKLTIEGL